MKILAIFSRIRIKYSPFRISHNSCQIILFFCVFTIFPSENSRLQIYSIERRRAFALDTRMINRFSRNIISCYDIAFLRLNVRSGDGYLAISVNVSHKVALNIDTSPRSHSSFEFRAYLSTYFEFADV